MKAYVELIQRRVDLVVRDVLAPQLLPDRRTAEPLAPVKSGHEVPGECVVVALTASAWMVADSYGSRRIV